MMLSTVICALVLLACTLSAAQESCKGRCGAEYYRGYMCQCDYTCVLYDECCDDYISQCTTKNSCKGRCGENFRRGRMCSCDSDCVKFKHCCSDYKTYCDAEEEISGAASATEPVKINSCPSVNNIKSQETTTAKDTKDPASTFSKGNDTDYIPVVSPATDELSDDTYSLPNDELTTDGLEDLQTSPVPESTSGDELSTADPLDQTSTGPTQDPDTEEFTTEALGVNEGTQASDNLGTPHPTAAEATTETTAPDGPTSSSDVGTPLPQSTTGVDHISTRPSPTPELQTVSVPQLQTAQADIQPGDFPEVKDPSAGPSDMPEVTPPGSSSTPASPSSSTVLENSQPTSISGSSTLEQTAIPEKTTPNTATDAKEVTKDPQLQNHPTTRVPLTTDAAQGDAIDDVTPGVTTAGPSNVSPDSPKATPKPQAKPDQPPPAKPALIKPPTKPEIKPVVTPQSVNVDTPRDFQADDSNDINLCSGRPVSAVTTLRNGTIVVFRGHFFWFLDRNMVPGPARNITQVWGVPSPIDTVFTRCNCQGKTYIFKGGQYWRFENDFVDPGYPKLIHAGFDGLRGHITAALSVPQYRTRRESVYFFKRGGLVQKYSYQFGTSSTCSKKPQNKVYAVLSRTARQAAPLLGPTINIRTSWRGFPSTITAAVSIPSVREPEGYKYHVFSRSKSYNVRMDSEHPAIPTQTAGASSQNNFFKCPNKV